MDSGPELAGPITSSQRIVSIDVLRGFAVLGILVMNIQSFAMISVAYMNPTAYGDLQGANYWVWYFCHVLADQKMMTIFSMLFGAGIVVMTSRSEAAGRGSAGVHYRRMGWLLVLGLLHAHLLWYGDILYFYALCGMVAYLFRKMPPWLLLLLGLASVSIASGIAVFSGLSMPTWPQEQIAQFTAESWMPTQETLTSEIEAYRGGWLDQMSHRVPSAFFFETFLLLFAVGWRAGGMMLIGMALFKTRVFSAARSRLFYAVMMVLGGGVGGALIVTGIHRNFAAGWDVKYSFFLGSQYNYWGSIPVALAWVGAVMLACRTAALGPVTRTLAAVGRMALTCYLLQTVICTTIFYGHGLGLFGRLDRVQQLLTVVGVWAFLLVLAPIWLKHFRFGPAEWLWRTLTYMKPQSMRQ